VNRYPRDTPIPKPVPKRKRPKGLRRFNPERKARLKETQEGQTAEEIRNLPCFACLAEDRGFVPRVAYAAHAKTRGGGGKEPDQVPNCHRHEIEFHNDGPKTFNANYGINLQKVARDLHAHLTGPDRERTTPFYFQAGHPRRRIRVLIPPATRRSP